MPQNTRTTYLNAALDQLQQAIRLKDTDACNRIFQDVQSQYPADADMIRNHLIAAGMRRALGGR